MAAGADELIVNVVGQDAYDQVQKLTDALQVLEKLVPGINNIGGSTNIEELTNQTKKLQVSIEGVTTASKNAQDATKSLETSRDRAAAQAQKQALLDKKITDDATNSYKQLSLAYRDAAERAKNYSLNIGATSPITIQATAEAKAMGDKLKELDATTGQFNRNVGNYSSAFTGYAMTLRGLRGPTKLLGEAIGIGATAADQFRLIIEHSLQGLAAFFRSKEKKIATEVADTAAVGSNTLANSANAVATEGLTVAEGEATVATVALTGAQKALKIALYSTGIIAIVALIAVIIVKLVEWHEASKAASEAQKLVNDALNAGQVEANKTIVSMDALYRATQNTTLSTEQRLAAVKKLQDEYPDYFKNISNETFLNGGAEKSYDSLKEAIIATAKATAISSAISKIYSDGLEKETKLRQQIADAQNIQAKEKGKGVNIAPNIDESGLAKGVLITGAQMDIERQQATVSRQKDLADYQKSQEAKIKILTDSLDNQTSIVLAHPDIDGHPDKAKKEKSHKAEDNKLAREEAERIKQGLLDKAAEAREIAETNKAISDNDKNNFDIRLQAQYKYEDYSIRALLAKDAAEKKTSAETGEDLTKLLITLNEQKVAMQDKYDADELKKAEFQAKNIEAVKIKTKKGSDVGKTQTHEEYNKDQIDQAGVYLDTATSVANAVSTIQSQAAQKRADELNNEIDLINKARDADIAAVNASVRTADEKAKAIADINARAAAKTTDLQNKANAEKVKAAQLAKAINIAEIIGKTALAVVSQLSIPVTGFAAAVAAGIAGAAELAIAIATPIPQYAEGVEDSGKRGLAIVGDGGRSEVVEHGGKAYLTPSTPTLVDLPAHSTVHKSVEDYLLEAQMLSMQGMGMMKHLDERKEASAIANGLKELKNSIDNKPVAQLNITGLGMQRLTRQAQSITEYIGSFSR